MKKQYIKPEAFAHDVELTHNMLLGTSGPGTGGADVGEGEELGREDNNSHTTTPNLWEQDW